MVYQRQDIGSWLDRVDMDFITCMMSSHGDVRWTRKGNQVQFALLAKCTIGGRAIVITRRMPADEDALDS